MAMINVAKNENESTVSVLKYQKNCWSQNIGIGLILKTVHWTMFSSSAIGLEKKILNEIVYYKTKYLSTFIFFYF